MIYNTDLEISDLSQSIDMPGYARNNKNTPEITGIA